jgi:hypothetical protein
VIGIALRYRSGSGFSQYNFTNSHQNLGVITTTAQPMRQLQLGLKYAF